MKNNVGSEAGAVARSTGVGGRADFCSMQNLHSRRPWRSSRRRAYMGRIYGVLSGE